MKSDLFLCLLALSLLGTGCEIIDDDPEKHCQGQDNTVVDADGVAMLLSRLPIGREQMDEVYDAVKSSASNGYDEEYTMADLFETPGKGVGEEGTKAAGEYGFPLKEMIRQYVSARTKAGESTYTEAYIRRLMSSDLQIYWPYSESWDGNALPVISFDPGGTSVDTNIGYKITCENGKREVTQVVVDEKMARERPVWIVNENSDSGHKTAEVLRREHPEWEEGGLITVRPKSVVKAKAGYRSLVLRDFTMKRNYDNWFAGASEFFVKIGAVEDFTASTEAEMKLYNPSVTDMLIVVKRSQLGKPVNLDVILVSEMTEQLEKLALMVCEDDGGTRTTWKCTALVRVASKSYGIEISIPINEWDDIVWRGQLSQNYLLANNGKTGHFGNVDITFGIEEY